VLGHFILNPFVSEKLGNYAISAHVRAFEVVETEETFAAQFRWKLKRVVWCYGDVYVFFIASLLSVREK
jgi:hypothetical protein